MGLIEELMLKQIADKAFDLSSASNLAVLSTATFFVF